MVMSAGERVEICSALGSFLNVELKADEDVWFYLHPSKTTPADFTSTFKNHDDLGD